MQNQVRFKKRVPCAFRDENGQHVGMALNVSQRGLFVSSRVTPQVGSRVLLDFSLQSGPSATGIAARVVWKRRVHRSARAMSDGGIGLEVEDGLEAYAHLLRVLVPEMAETLAAAESASPTPFDASSLPAFRVRVALSGTPRTRFVDAHGADESAAAAVALAGLGEGWRVLEILEAGPPLDPDDSRF